MKKKSKHVGLAQQMVVTQHFAQDAQAGKRHNKA